MMSQEEVEKGSEADRSEQLPKPSRQAKEPMWFTQRQGSIETRAETVRPLDPTLRSYYLGMAVAFLSFGSPVLISLTMPFLLPVKEIAADPGSLVMPVALLIFGLMSLLMYLADCLRRCALAAMSTAEIRERLAKSEKSAKYVAKPKHLRGARIGSWFFGVLAAAYFVGLVVTWIGGWDR